VTAAFERITSGALSRYGYEMGAAVGSGAST
jgi:hypothetical protein